MLRMRESDWLDKAEVETDMASQLIILLARPHLTDAQADLAKELASTIQDWDGFVKTCSERFIVPLAMKHLQAIKADLPAHVVAQARNSTFQVASDSLRLLAAQQKFHKTCIEPVNAPHLYLKGLTLAAQYYGQVGVRRCRDIDVFVEGSGYDLVLQRALDQGYRLLLSPTLWKFAETPEEFDFARRFQDVISLITPDHVHIELHRRIETATGIFDGIMPKIEPDPVVINNVTYLTMPLPWLFNYVVLHHSRHFWSHLHWLADMDAMASHPKFDREATLALARKLGIEATVAAALDMNSWSKNPQSWPKDLSSTNGGRFLKLAIFNLTGDDETEHFLQSEAVMGQFIGNWQLSPKLMQTAWKRWIQRSVKPHVAQWQASPKPPSLYWIYQVENILRLIGTVLLSLVLGVQTSNKR